MVAFQFTMNENINTFHKHALTAGSLKSLLL